MVELHCVALLANSAPKAKELITTSLREKTEAALQVGLKYATSKGASQAYSQTKKAFRCLGVKGNCNVIKKFNFEASKEAAQEAAEAAQLKSQLENLLEVKEQIHVLQHHKEAAEAVSAQLVQGVRRKCAGCPHTVQDVRT